MVSIDIGAAFLQVKVLDQDVFVVPPADIRNQGKVQKLLMMMDDASRKFWLKVRVILKIGLKTLKGDEAFYFLNEGRKYMQMTSPGPEMMTS